MEQNGKPKRKIFVNVKNRGYEKEGIQIGGQEKEY